MPQTLQEYVNQHGGQRVLKRILIANNGMAATKAIMSMRQWAFLELGSQSELEFVVMASKDDLEANAEFIRLADKYVEVPAGKNTNNYANVPLIVKTALEQRVDCVWPGWGHASEKPELPLALKDAGITFLGPTAPVMHALGDKIASTILAQSSKVPCIPWNGDGILADIQADGSIPQEPFKKACLQNFEEALACAKRIGYPVVLKASEGGGGKGIRKCTDDAELKVGWEQVIAEVVGSPIFMMQLCTGARHLEVQLVGDEYGQVVSLIGRDCSTQRRFQKIFEEGPPTIADKDDFREAEKAAQRLAMSVGYRGAGTVEYLYKPATKGFYFLELNPRLQVEHPVTEGITGVNVPALQLLIGMGIPLERVPDIRRFYGIDAEGTSKIDFLNDKYVYPKNHVIAARVTAENPDDAFRPTSGTIERVRFQSTPSCWGYFSIGVAGKIHEFADSQFGHIFASGPTREHARKALQLALKNIFIRGEVRNPTEYLVELAETEEFKQNTIDTAWLDRLIAAKAVNVKFNMINMVFYGACLKAFLHLKAHRSELIDGIRRGHLPLRSMLELFRNLRVDIAYNSIKYNFQVACTAHDTFALTINGTTMNATYREQPDGSLYLRAGDKVVQISGVEEPLGLRLRVEGQATVTFPKVRDPSELLSDFNGKLVRYLHADGDDVKEGQPFVELEAMKMIMSLRSTVAGKIHHTLGPGAIVAQGDLLATLTLADPSKVQMIQAFSGDFRLNSDEKARSISASADDLLNLLGPSVPELLNAKLNGFSLPPDQGLLGGVGMVHDIFSNPDEHNLSGTPDVLEACCQLLATFLSNERFFASLVGGDETQTIKRFQGTPEELLAKIVAHNRLGDSVEIITAVLRSISDGPLLEGEVEKLPQPMIEQLEELSRFPDAGGYSQVKLLAAQILTQMRNPLNVRREEVRKMLGEADRQDLAKVACELGAKRQIAKSAGSTYIYDFPALMRISLAKLWMQHTPDADSIPEKLISAQELVLDSGELVPQEQNGKNKIGMVAWMVTLKTPEYPNGRDMILVGNDITIKGGSFGTVEDEVFYQASKLARARGIPRIYIACNSGARIGGVDELKSIVQVCWVNKDDPMKGFEYLYFLDADYKKLPPKSVKVSDQPITVNGEVRHKLEAIIGEGLASTKGGIGVECLQGSGLIAGETSRAYEETFTLSYATGRSVGIGAYLNRLGQRNIQMVKGAMILTGPEPLNKLMGKQIYTSQDQLGGPHIMVPNGVTHELVHNDQDGVEAILRWLSFVPETVNALPPSIQSRDPVARAVQFMPTKAAYDPRLMLAGGNVDGEWKTGWCDEGSFTEYMSGWGKTVVVGRGRVGGLPVGIIAVETRSCEKHIPADPQEPASRDVIEMQAGQVWYPDSAYKTAQTIRDFSKGEGLPVVIFANWRGFSGGTRDMFGEVLKYGSMIVDALVDTKHPVTIYIPPNGELRGGAWVVLDPKINPESIEMFADVESRGGILEPAGAAEIIFKKDKHTIDMMHRCDEKLRDLGAKKEAGQDVSADIAQREKLLLPLYQQVAQEYCDLHDLCPRMESLGAIRKGLEWKDSRSYLHWRIRRRVQENSTVRRLMRTVSGMTFAQASAIIADLVKDVATEAGEAAEDQAVALWIEEHSDQVEACVEQARQRAAEEEIFRLAASLPAPRMEELVRDLVGYARVASSLAPGSRS